MTRKISVMFIAAAAAFLIWNSSAAQYSQDTTKTTRQSDTTMKRMQIDTARGHYPNRSTDTTMRRNRSQYDTTHVRSWTPSSSQPDTSSGLH